MEKRLREIEDRKIEILLEISDLNSRYEKDVSALNTEYEKLNREQYHIKVDIIGKEN